MNEPYVQSLKYLTTHITVLFMGLTYLINTENSNKNRTKIVLQNISSVSAFSLGVLPIIPLSPVHSQQVQSFSEKKEGSIQTVVFFG